MGAQIGSTVTVKLFSTMADYKSNADRVEVQAHIISQGPPGVGADWGRTTETPGRWILVRPIRGGVGRQEYYAALDDPGM